jgi:hypothetical protein
MLTDRRNHEIEVERTFYRLADEPSRHHSGRLQQVRMESLISAR